MLVVVANVLYIAHLLWAGINFCHLRGVILWASFSTVNHLLYNFNGMLAFHVDAMDSLSCLSVLSHCIQDGSFGLVI